VSRGLETVLHECWNVRIVVPCVVMLSFFVSIFVWLGAHLL
jgi:hypothetical protein